MAQRDATKASIFDDRSIPKVRRATPNDAPYLWDLLSQFATSYRPDLDSFGRTLAELIVRTDAAFIVIERDDVVFGYLLGFYLPTLFANGEVMEFIELVVDHPYRGQGLGRTLVASALELARERKCREVVVPTRRASTFYERLGFTETATYFKLKL